MNQHIKTYCKDYITSPMSPLFAVLIKGKWGCGKTHIVKEVLHDEWGYKWQNNAIWLSVYGISNILQLNTKLYEKMHPVLTHKLTKFGTSLAKSALKLSAGFDLYKFSLLV